MTTGSRWWHRMPAGDVPLDPLEVLTLAGNPRAFHPDGPLDDVGGALDQLLATGWVVELGGAHIAVVPD